MRRPRELRLRLDDPAMDQVVAFAAAAYPGQPIQAAARELLLIGAAAEPAIAAVAAVRLAAYRHFSSVARQALAAALRQLAADLEVEELLMREGVAREG